MVAISDNARGAAFMVGSMTAFTLNDVFMKLAGADLPLFQAVFLRGLCVLGLLTVLCVAMGQLRTDFSRKDWALMCVRGMCEVVVAYLFISALFNMPIANVSAILQALPLTVSLAAALFLGEALGWRRLVAILVGFIGVLLIVQPGGTGFNAYALWVVAAVFVVTLRDLAARRMSRDVPSTMAALVAAVFVTCASGVASAYIDWTPMTFGSWGLLAGAGVFIIGGYIFSVSAMRVGEISVVAPFRYTSLLVALITGYIVFAEIPNTLALIGATIVVVTGLFTLYREGRARKTRAALVFK